MFFTEEQRKEVIDTIRGKAPSFGPCVICGHTVWVLQDGFVMPALQDEVGVMRLGGTTLPSIAITCQHCGNTHMLNVIVLGLRHLLEQRVKEK